MLFSYVSYSVLVRLNKDNADTRVCTAVTDAEAADDHLMLVIILSALSSLFLVIISVLTTCLCPLRRRPPSDVHAGNVPGLDHPTAARLSSVSPSGVLSQTAAGPRWFPEYGLPAATGPRDRRLLHLSCMAAVATGLLAMTTCHTL